jgi:transposase
VSRGKRPKDLEDLYDTSFKSICNWIHRLNEGGVEALLDKPKPGRPKRLDANQMEQLKNAVLNLSPEDFGFNSSTWTGPIVAEWLGTEFGLLYKKAQVYNILHGLGLSFQKGKGFYPEAGEREEKIAEAKKNSNSKGKPGA